MFKVSMAWVNYSLTLILGKVICVAALNLLAPCSAFAENKMIVSSASQIDILDCTARNIDTLIVSGDFIIAKSNKKSAVIRCDTIEFQVGSRIITRVDLVIQAKKKLVGDVLIIGEPPKISLRNTVTPAKFSNADNTPKPLELKVKDMAKAQGASGRNILTPDSCRTPGAAEYAQMRGRDGRAGAVGEPGIAGAAGSPGKAGINVTIFAGDFDANTKIKIRARGEAGHPGGNGTAGRDGKDGGRGGNGANGRDASFCRLGDDGGPGGRGGDGGVGGDGGEGGRGGSGGAGGRVTVCISGAALFAHNNISIDNRGGAAGLGGAGAAGGQSGNPGPGGRGGAGGKRLLFLEGGHAGRSGKAGNVPLPSTDGADGSKGRPGSWGRAFVGLVNAAAVESGTNCVDNDDRNGFLKIVPAK